MTAFYFVWLGVCVVWCVCVWYVRAWVHGCMRACMCVCIRSSLHSVRFGQLLQCAHKCIVNIMKVYIKRNNKHVELIRFCKKISPLSIFTFAKRGIQRDPWVYDRKVVRTEACSIVITLIIRNISTLGTKLARKVLPTCACRHCTGHKARTQSPSHMCMFDKCQFDYNLLLFTPFLTV